MPESLLTTHPHAWTEAETRQLMDLFLANEPANAIAAKLGRSRCSVYCRIFRVVANGPKRIKRQQVAIPIPVKKAPPPKPPTIIDAPTVLDAAEHAMRHQLRNWDWQPTGTPEPVQAWPGSPEKIKALASRVEAGVEMWDKADGVEDLQ